jgi:multisubunit Na+/H+ antiporter MnhF subunit
MVRKVLTVSGALVAGFHVWLFISQLGDGRLADVGVLARWGVAAALGMVLWYLRRQRVPLFWGRKAVAVWVLAALLHGPSLTDRLSAVDTTAVAEVATVMLQVTGSAAWLTLLALVAVLLSRRGAAASTWFQKRSAPVLLAIHRLCSTPVAPRPPPAL